MALAHGPIPGKPTKSLVSSLGAPLSLLLAIGLIVAAMLLPVVQSSDATTTGYAIQKHAQELADLDAQVYNTQAEVAQLDSTDRVRKDAARLGLVQATPAAAAISVNAPAPDGVLLPRRFIPAPTPAPVSDVHHSMFWKVVHALPLP
jgi:hypothetical protein